MSANLSPENEAFLAELVSRHEFADRDAVLDEAVGLLRRRRTLLDDVATGVEQLRTGQIHRYGDDELDRFLTDVAARERQRFAAD